MTISSEVRKAGPFSGNDVTTAFSFSFKVFSTADVLAVSADSLGLETDLTEGVDYTVSLNANQNANPGGTVTLTSPLATGYTLVLTSQVQNLQPTDLTNQGGFYPAVINAALDRATIQIQQIKEQVDRAVKVGIADTQTPEQLKTALFEAEATAIANAALSASSAQNSGNSANAAAASAVAAAASAALADSEGNATAAQASRNAAESAASVATAARDAATVNANVYVDVATGLAAVTDGQQFQVVSADGLSISRYRRDAGPVSVLVATYPTSALDALMVNAGKAYPLKATARDGVTSAAHVAVNNSVLSIRVLGARPGKVYRLEFIGNGTTALPGGLPNYEMLFNEHDKATYASSSAASRVEVIKLGDIPATSIEAGSVITRVFKSTRVEGISFVVTYRPALLPAGSQAVLNSVGQAGYSWIIDENCYEPMSDDRALAVADVKLIGVPMLNETAAYPLKATARDGSTSTASAAISASLLDIKVIGARPGKVYRLEFIGNGTTALPGGLPNYEMLFNEYEKSNYASASDTGKVEVIKLGDIPATSVEAGAVITRAFSSTRVPGIHFVVTYKPAALPVGQAALNSVGNPCYSWIIDENCYIPGTGVDEATFLSKMARPMAWSIAAGALSVAFRLNDTHDLRLKVERFGVNNIYNINNLAVAAHSGSFPRIDRSWTGITSNGTDWIGPYHVSATSGGDGGAINFTGGVHGSTGGFDGDPTASHQSVAFSVDGLDVAGDGGGYATTVVATWTNRVQGYNTKTTGREILEETITLRITAGCVEVQAEIKALEDLSIKRYYGLQAQCGGFSASVHMVGGQQGGRFVPAPSTDYTSGAFSTYPNIPAIVTRGSYGDFWMVLDNTYGFGAARSIDASSPTAQYTEFSKAYHTLAYSGSGKALSSGQKLPWRGAYAWGENLSLGGLCDSAARFSDGADITYMAVMGSAGTAEINVAPQDKNRPTVYQVGSGDARTGARSTSVTAAGYGVVKFAVD